MTTTMFRNAATAAFLMLALTACFGSLTSTRPPEYYGLDYAYEASPCSRNDSEDGLRVWSFTASAPYNRAQMVITNPSQKVSYSSQHQWVAPPGDMIADILLRDISLSHMFSKTVSAGDPYTAQDEMSGHVFRFGWEDFGSKGRAVIELEVSLWKEKPKRAVLLRKHYQFESEFIAELNPETFARAMSGLVQRVSRQLRQDICAIR